MKSICLLIKRLNGGGGLEKYALKLSSAFASKGCKVTILTTNAPNNLKLHPSIKIEKHPIKSFLKFQEFSKYTNLCKKWQTTHQYDLIFGLDRCRHQTHLRAGNGVHAAFLENRKVFDPYYKTVTAFLNPINRSILSIEKEAFESPDLRILFTNSYMVRKEVLAHYNTDIDKIQVVHNGVEWKEMDKDFHEWIEQKTNLALEIGLDPTTYHFLFVGNGYHRKGLTPLLDALSILPMNDFHLSVIGKEKRTADFIAYTKQLGLTDKVSFLGVRKDVRRFYQLSDSLVVPSYYDPFANVTVEALAMGLLVISSKTNGGHEVLKENNGFVIPDLQDKECFADILYRATLLPKTWIRSKNIRNSIKSLDFSNQLSAIVDMTLKSIHE